MNEQGIHLICCSWGVKRFILDSNSFGWDVENILEKAARGGGGGIPGSADLSVRMVRMTPDERRVDRGYEKLSKKLQDAMWLKYVQSSIPRDDDTEWTNRKLADILGVPMRTFTKRLDMAKRKIKVTEFRG